jgi:hypothetical protein
MIGFCAVQADAFGPMKKIKPKFFRPSSRRQMEGEKLQLASPCLAAQPVSFSYILSSDFFGIMAVQSPKPVNTPVWFSVFTLAQNA